MLRKVYSAAVRLLLLILVTTSFAPGVAWNAISAHDADVAALALEAHPDLTSHAHHGEQDHDHDGLLHGHDSTLHGELGHMLGHMPIVPIAALVLPVSREYNVAPMSVATVAIPADPLPPFKPPRRFLSA
jgi:hypothetical protein